MIVIENLSLSSFLQVFILCLKEKQKHRNYFLYYIDSSPRAEKFARKLSLIFSVHIEKLNFICDDLVDEKGYNFRLKIQYNDLMKIFSKISKKNLPSDKYLSGYIQLYLLTTNWPKKYEPNSVTNKSLSKILLMLQASAIQSKNNLKNDRTLFIIEKRPWIIILRNYANDIGIRLHTKKVFYYTFLNYLSLFHILRKISHLMRYITRYVSKKSTHKINKNESFSQVPFSQDGFSVDRNNIPKIICDQVMQFFGASSFWLSSELLPDSIVFVSKTHTISQNELDDINQAGMSFIALSSRIADGLNVPFYPFNKKYASNYLKDKHVKKFTWEEKIVAQCSSEYIKQKRIWKDFFNITGAKIYVSHGKCLLSPIPAASAIDEMGGISALWQTSYYEFPNPYAAVFSDVYFPFSPKVAECEKKSGSAIKYLVSTGYIFDHRFQLLDAPAKAIKRKLRNQGAEKIISFFDGGSIGDERWNVSRINIQKDYQFWFEKVLEEPWLGLIIKSKRPGDLRIRLGETVGLLNEVIQTGRCYFNEEYDDRTGKNLKSRPSEAALASDIAIAQFLSAGSAGLEAALCGTPTLLFDRYGLKHSQFYNLGVGRVVFNDWDIMWDTLKEHWIKEPIQGFGDWSPIRDDLDPFSDGKSAYRMTTYLNWLLEGFKQGLERETILADAAERYVNQWGDDKVVYMA